MTTLETAEKIILQLSPAELALFREWFAEYDGDIWDTRIEEDATAGKLDALAAGAFSKNGAETLPEAQLAREADARNNASVPVTRDAERVARVKSLRGKFAQPGRPLASEELHQERQRDKAREEMLSERKAS